MNPGISLFQGRLPNDTPVIVFSHDPLVRFSPFPLLPPATRREYVPLFQSLSDAYHFSQGFAPLHPMLLPAGASPLKYWGNYSLHFRLLTHPLFHFSFDIRYWKFY